LHIKRSKFTEAQIVFAIKQSETGVAIAEICRKMGISEATFYNWKKKYGGLGISELRQLRQLQEENSKLKQIVADLSLDKQMLQDVLKKSFKSSAEEAAGRRSTKRLQGSYFEGVPSHQFASFRLVL
jgi:putative transposase